MFRNSENVRTSGSGASQGYHSSLSPRCKVGIPNCLLSYSRGKQLNHCGFWNYRPFCSSFFTFIFFAILLTVGILDPGPSPQSIVNSQFRYRHNISCVGVSSNLDSNPSSNPSSPPSLADRISPMGWMHER